MRAAHMHEHIGERNICPNIESPLKRASEIHAHVAA